MMFNEDRLLISDRVSSSLKNDTLMAKYVFENNFTASASEDSLKVFVYSLI